VNCNDLNRALKVSTNSRRQNDATYNATYKQPNVICPLDPRLIDGADCAVLRKVPQVTPCQTRHFWLPLLLLWILWRIGYDRRAFRAWTVLAWGLMLVCYFLMPAPPAPPSNPNLPVNINYVYGMSGDGPQTRMPPLAYFGLLMIVLPTCVFLPTHLILRAIFRNGATPVSTASNSGCP
jgi:hypothetical protein